MAGWCTSGLDLEDSPEVEVMSGGINGKTPQHAALWRQGNLLHFGFQETPSEFNATGRALLENAVVYIARFGDDRPIAVTSAGFTRKDYPRSRGGLRRALAKPDVTAKELARYLSTELRGEIENKAAEEAKCWIEEHMRFLAADATGRLAVDEDAKALAIALDAADFFAQALLRAADADKEKQALSLLTRRIPEGPGADAKREAWKAFLDANKAYLFFTERGGYVWLLDPLAKKRGVATADLRGSRRAGD